MKFLACFLALLPLVFAGNPTEAPTLPPASDDTCEIESGSRVKTFNSRDIRITAPCKFKFIDQPCGSYNLRFTPGLKYFGSRYVWETIWLRVSEISDDTKVWYGRSTNQKVQAAIIWGLDKRDALFPSETFTSTLSASSLFNVTSTPSTVVVKAANGDFTLELGAYDFTGSSHRDSTVKFTCHTGSVTKPYPQQLCGQSGNDGLKEHSQSLWGKKTSAYQDLTALYSLFNDAGLTQVDSYCAAASTAFRTQCNTEALKKEALIQCHQILSHHEKTNCVQKYACEPIRIFESCLKFVCSGYTDDVACSVVGEGIDMCRDIGKNLTQEMKKARANGKPGCYRKWFTAEDNPHFMATLY